MAAKKQPEEAIAYGRNSRIKLIPLAAEGLALVDFTLSDGIAKYDQENRFIHARDAYSADELMAFSKALSTTARRLNRGA